MMMKEEQNRFPDPEQAFARLFEWLYERRGTGAGKERFKTLGSAALRAVVLTLCALALGGAPAFGGICAFGVALLCAADGYLPLAAGGLCVGALLRGQVLLPAVYLILLLFRLITRMWLGEEGERIRYACAGCGMALYGVLLTVVRGGNGAWLTALAGVGAGVFFTVCFRALVREDARWGPMWETGVFAAVYAAGCATADLRIATVSVGYFLGFILCVHIARVGGSARGCVAGVLWGLACGAQYAPAFALAALIAGRTSSTLLGVGGGAVFCMLYASFTGGYYAVRDFLPDIGIAAAVYAPLYRYRLLPREGLFGEYRISEADSARAEAERAAAKETEERLTAMAQALHSLSAIFYGMSERLQNAEGYEEREDMTRVFAEDYASMSSMISGALAECADGEPDYALSGKVRGALAATGFRCAGVSVCGKRKKLVVARGVSRSGASTDPELLRRRLSGVCGVPFFPPDFLVEGESITMTARSAPTLRAIAAHAAARKQGEEVSGDCVTAFRAGDGRFYCLLCDGMGSGKDAAVAARTCCIFLQKMLEGGNDAAASLQMLNSFLRGKGYECFATVDLCCIDLFTGGAYFIKGGSAPSYLLRGENRYKITSASVPVGIIREVRAERISFEVKAGDRIVMASDGVEDGERSVVERADRALFSEHPEAVAGELLRRARSAHGARDDATVCVISIEDDRE